MKSTFSFLGLFLVALLTSMPSIATIKVTAIVSDNQVVLGDQLILTVSINDNDNDYQLDTRSLESGFTVYRPSRSQSTEYVNGEFSQKTMWQVRLKAIKTGILTIPSLKIGDYKTDPISIKVTKISQQSTNNNDLERVVFIENKINKQSIYVGQSFIFTTKLYISRNTNELELKGPYFEGAENSVLGQDQRSQTDRNGIRYDTVTRQYKMTATQAGEFKIDSPLLTGTLRKKRQNRVAEPINVRGERLSIKVQPIPDNYQGDWIISEDLNLIEDNQLTLQSYKVGEAITRSITLQIASIDKDKLPNIKLNYPKSLRVYPDQDKLVEGEANGLQYGVRIIRHAIIADEVGTLTLPEIKLNWFNSQTNQQETAVLPAQNLTIIAADKQQITNVPAIQPTIKELSPTVIIDNSELIYWKIAVGLSIMTMLSMVFYHLSYRRLITDNKPVNPVKVIPINETYLTLQNSFNKNIASICYSALLHYAQEQYPNLKSLSQLAEKIELSATDKQNLKDEIQHLQQCCSEPEAQWNASKLAELIKTYEASSESKRVSDPMDINP